MQSEPHHEANGMSAKETLGVLASVLLPTVARGANVRRPIGEAWATATGSDRRIVSTLRALRERHGDDPLPLRCTGRRIALAGTARGMATDERGRMDAVRPS